MWPFTKRKTNTPSPKAQLTRQEMEILRVYPDVDLEYWKKWWQWRVHNPSNHLSGPSIGAGNANGVAVYRTNPIKYTQLEGNPGHPTCFGITDSLLLVLFANDGVYKEKTKEDETRNVWAFSREGEFLWKIAPNSGDPVSSKPYVDFDDDSNGLIATNENGIVYCVDGKTGHVTPVLVQETSTTYKLLELDTIQIADKIIKLPCSIVRRRLPENKTEPIVIEYQGLIIVGFYPWGTEEGQKIFELEKQGLLNMKRNIWAFDQKGDLVWQVAPAEQGEANNCWSGCHINDEGQLQGGTICGVDFILDPATGNILSVVPGRPW